MANRNFFLFSSFWVTNGSCLIFKNVKVHIVSLTVFGKKNINIFFLAHQPEASRPDFLMCGDTALFCYLLRSHGGRTSPFRDVPASGGLGRMKLKTFKFGWDLSLKTRWFFGVQYWRLHMYGMVLLQYVPVSWRYKMLQDRKWLGHDWHWLTQRRSQKTSLTFHPWNLKNEDFFKGPCNPREYLYILQSEHFKKSNETTAKDAELWVQIKIRWPLNTPPRRLFLLV